MKSVQIVKRCLFRPSNATLYRPCWTDNPQHSYLESSTGIIGDSLTACLPIPDFAVR